jgi:fused signal recognition particle receptor
MLGLLRRSRQKSRETTEAGVKRSRESWFGRVAGLLRAGRLDEDVWEELEEMLVSADVGVETSLSLIEGLRNEAKERRLREQGDLIEFLKRDITARLADGRADDVWLESTQHAAPFVILVVGVNGSGKTTSIAKLAYHFKAAGKRVILAAGDTFRAAAIDQIQLWGERVGVDVVSHQPGGDPGAVAFDAFQAARARGADVLIVDTAGRLHTKSNLMDELKKVRRVISRLDPSAPHHVLLTLDATTGHNGLGQARYFTEAVGCTGIVLAKLDGTAKGGIVLAIKDQLNVPILFIGTGERLEDMAPFDAEGFVEALLEPAPSAS